MLSTRTFWPFSRPEGFDSFASTDVKSRRRDSDGSNNFCAAREDTPAAHLSFHHGTKPQCVSEIRSTNLRDSFSLIRQRPAAATFWKGCFWGYRIRAEIKKRINYWAFSHDFDSVPGSQYNQHLTIRSCEGTSPLLRTQLTPRSPIRIPSLGRSSNPARMTKNLSRKFLIVFDCIFQPACAGGIFGGIEQTLEPMPPTADTPECQRRTQRSRQLAATHFSIVPISAKVYFGFHWSALDPSALQGNLRRRPSTDLSALIKRISTMHVHGRSSLLTPDLVPYPRSFLRLPAAATP
jgi:hypothetical protein